MESLFVEGSDTLTEDAVEISESFKDYLEPFVKEIHKVYKTREVEVVLTKVIHDLLSDITIDTTFKEMKEAAYGIVDNVEEPPEKILGTDKFPEMDVTYSEGFITIDNIPELQASRDNTLGLQISKKGQVWVCINGMSLMRFNPKFKG